MIRELKGGNPVSSSMKYFFAANYGYLEFRQILQNYKPVNNDVIRSLSDDGRAIVEAIHKIAKGYKMRETYSYFHIPYPLRLPSSILIYRFPIPYRYFRQRSRCR